MTPPEEFAAAVQEIEGATVKISRPRMSSSWTFIDLTINGARVDVVWQGSAGFAVSLPDPAVLPFDRVPVDGPHWRRAKGAHHALCLALVLLLRKQGDASP